MRGRHRRMLEILFFPIVLLATFPGAALLPGTVFTILYFKRTEKMTKLARVTVIFAALTWIVYGIYETSMYFWMKTVIAPIRVDLLLIVPMLYLITIIGTIASCKNSKLTAAKPSPGVDS
jgi:fatty acid desaturase